MIIDPQYIAKCSFLGNTSMARTIHTQTEIHSCEDDSVIGIVEFSMPAHATEISQVTYKIKNKSESQIAVENFTSIICPKITLGMFSSLSEIRNQLKEQALTLTRSLYENELGFKVVPHYVEGYTITNKGSLTISLPEID